MSNMSKQSIKMLTVTTEIYCLTEIRTPSPIVNLIPENHDGNKKRNRHPLSILESSDVLVTQSCR